MTTSTGITVEVVGVAEVPPRLSGPTSWWKPDGTPLESAPLDPSRNLIARNPDEQAREFAVRCSATGPDTVIEPLLGVAVAFSPTTNNYGNASLGGQSIPGSTLIETLLPANLETATIRGRVATGPWTPYPGGTTDGKRRTGPIDRQVLFLKGSEADGHASIVVIDSFSAKMPRSDVRVVAIDGDGHPHGRADDSPSGGPPVYGGPRAYGGPWAYGDSHDVRVHDVEFNLPLKEVREFQIQTRPFEPFEIKDIALRPRGPAPADSREK